MSNLLDIKQRCLAIEQAAIPGLTGVPYFMHTQSTYPYTTHRTGPIAYDYLADGLGSEEFIVDLYQIVIVLVIGSVTERYVGKTDAELDDYIEALQGAFSSTARGRWLLSATYPSRPTYLYPEGIALARSTGFDAVRNTGIQDQLVGAEIVLNVPVLRNIQVGS